MHESRSELPRLTKGTIERTRLLKRLADARHHTCVLIQGPAGSGKTTLASQWRAQVLSYGYDFAAVTVSSGDDIERLLDRLFSCLDRVDPALAREAAFLYNRANETRAAEPVAIALMRALTKHPRDLILLIDDYHLVQDARAHEFVQMLLDFEPPKFHLALASRSAPPLSLARLRDKGALLELDYRDLRFSFSETEELLRSQSADLPRRDARILYDMTDGWVAGLRLVALTLRSRPGRAKVELRNPVQNARDFRAYFNREVLASLSSGEVDAMTRLAAAPRFDEALCTALFGADAGQGLLERLRRDNVFLIPIEGAERGSWYRFHALFRDLLEERFAELPGAERQRTHSALGESFGRRKQLREAVHHCVAAGEVERAADWLGQYAQALFLNGELRRLVRAVAELPRTVLLSRVPLRLWVAWSHLCYRHLGACHQSLEELKATLPRNDENGQHHLALLEGSLAIQEDDTEAAERLLLPLDAMAPARDAILAGGRRNILGWFHAQRGDFALARQRLAGPHYLLESGEPLLDSAFGVLVGECLQGFSYLKEGDMRQAERALRETLRKSESELGPFCEAAANAAGFLGAVLYEIDELHGLRTLLEPRMDLIERAGLPDALICAAVMRSRLYQSEGSFQEALADVDRLEEIAHRRGLDRMLVVALAERTAIHLMTGDMQAAEDAVAQLRFTALRQAGRTSAAAIEVGWYAASGRATWLAAMRRDQEALDVLQPLISAGAFEQQLQARAQLVARSAVLQGRLKREREALDSIAEAWRIAQRMGLVRSLLDLGDEVLALGERASREGLLDEATRFHLERVTQQARQRESRMPPPLPKHEPLSEREIAIVKALAAALPNKRIGQALGISPETVKWHLKNVYSKLGVYGRDGAVARARDLGYVDPPS